MTLFRGGQRLYSRRNLYRVSRMFIVIIMALTSGCATATLPRARKHYYRGDFDRASTTLTENRTPSRDTVLVLMERGMIHHTWGQHDLAIHNWLDAADLIRELDYVRISEQASSLLINDRTQTYTGWPYERALLHAFTAKSYFMLQQWREAAVEARLIADGFMDLNGFPDDPYTRYVAGLAFEFIRDYNGSRIEYTQADELLSSLTIDPTSGSIAASEEASPPPRGSHEFICLIAIGRAPSLWDSALADPAWGTAPYAEIVHQGEVLGRSYTLNTTTELAIQTEKRIAAIQTAKTVTRIILKDSVATAVADNHPFLGEALRLLLFAIEMPDTRHWATLPRWLQVARVVHPPDAEDFDVVFRRTDGSEIRRVSVKATQLSESRLSVATVRIW